MYDEVFVGVRWARLNYNKLGQNIVDPNYYGLMMHINTCADISETDLARTWRDRGACGRRLSLPCRHHVQLIPDRASARVV
jgi:hypothetical protein